MATKTPVRWEAFPLLVRTRGYCEMGWLVWIERTHYADGSFSDVYRESESPV
jgi:hypothetical protein